MIMVVVVAVTMAMAVVRTMPITSELAPMRLPGFMIFAAAMIRMRVICAHGAEIKPAGVHYKHRMRAAEIDFDTWNV